MFSSQSTLLIISLLLLNIYLVPTLGRPQAAAENGSTDVVGDGMEAAAQQGDAMGTEMQAGGGGPGGFAGEGHHGGPGGGGRPMLAALHRAGMPMPEFIKQLNKSDIAEFVAIKSDMSLTKGQIVSNTQNWLQKQSADFQNQYAAWQNNVTQWKTDTLNKVKQNVSGDAATLFNKIQSIVEDQSITHPETCKQIMEALNASTHETIQQLHAAAEAIGLMPPGGSGFHHPGGAPPANGEMSIQGGATPPAGGGVSHQGMHHMCAGGGPAAMHDGPGGHLASWHKHLEGHLGQEGQETTAAPVAVQ